MTAPIRHDIDFRPRFVADVHGQQAEVIHYGFEPVTLPAEHVDYGLVLHLSLDIYGEPSQTDGYSVSDPDTGYSVVGGETREQALHNLDLLVLRNGGPEGFAVALQQRRAAILARRAEITRLIAEDQAVMADVHRVIAPETPQ